MLKYTEWIPVGIFIILCLTHSAAGTNNKMHTYGTIYITVNKPLINVLQWQIVKGEKCWYKISTHSLEWDQTTAETAGKPGMRNSYMKARVCGFTFEKQQHHHQKRLDERGFFIILTVVQIVHNNCNLSQFIFYSIYEYSVIVLIVFYGVMKRGGK